MYAVAFSGLGIVSLPRDAIAMLVSGFSRYKRGGEERKGGRSVIPR